MEIQYRNRKIEKVCTNMDKAICNYGKDVAKKLFMTINLLKQALNLLDVKKYPPANLHPLKGNRNGEWSIYLGKTSGFRLIVTPIDENGGTIKVVNDEDYINVLIIEVVEVSKHYE